MMAAMMRRNVEITTRALHFSSLCQRMTKGFAIGSVEVLIQTVLGRV